MAGGICGGIGDAAKCLPGGGENKSVKKTSLRKSAHAWRQKEEPA